VTSVRRGLDRRPAIAAIETPDDEWRAVMDVNINGVFWCCRAFGRHMIAQRLGSIVNLGSMSGLIINRPQTAASDMASKGAVHMLTKALATEWAKSGVRVNALAPGYVATAMTLKMRERPELFNVLAGHDPDGPHRRTVRGRRSSRLPRLWPTGWARYRSGSATARHQRSPAIFANICCDTLVE
jgi:NAD(P)-dependent dehydrogenase (short-subunit alcohol dehydrogenase family)